MSNLETLKNNYYAAATAYREALRVEIELLKKSLDTWYSIPYLTKEEDKFIQDLELKLDTLELDFNKIIF